MNTLLEKLNMKFDTFGNVTLSKQQLISFVDEMHALKVFSDQESFPVDCYAVANKKFMEFYPFPKGELAEWEKDGSCEKGEALYEIKLVKKY